MSIRERARKHGPTEKGGMVVMNTPSRGSWHARWLALLVLVAVAIWLPAAQAQEGNGRGSTDGLLAKLSQSAAVRYLLAHP